MLVASILRNVQENVRYILRIQIIKISFSVLHEDTPNLAKNELQITINYICHTIYINNSLKAVC